jgi:hypothetical protein
MRRSAGTAEDAPPRWIAHAEGMVLKKRERTTRRLLERDAEKLARAREKLAALEEGGSPERPAEVGSASQIEGRASQLECLACGELLKVKEHRAISHPTAGALRELELGCPRCRRRRVAYYRVGPRLN